MADAMTPRLILASQSRARQTMLSGAGIAFDVVPARIDESALRAARLADDANASAPDIAALLAKAKAESISQLHPQSFVIGSDQVLECEGELYEKPSDLGQAANHLQALRGREHRLVSAVALARNGAVDFMARDTARLWMRQFSDAYLDQYLKSEAGICDCVGAYRLEGRGLQLFERIEGDYFTILGMPLLPLLGALRHYDVLMT
jgi:septum formation protein